MTTDDAQNTKKLTGEGFFSNGDIWTGEKTPVATDESLRVVESEFWWGAVDSNGQEYQTTEVPARHPLFTLRQYMGAWSAEDFKGGESWS